MLKFLKNSLTILISLFLLLCYFIFTPLGNLSLYPFLSYEISKRTEMQIEIQSLNILKYPEIEIVAHIERKAKLSIKGVLKKMHLDMLYTLNSNCIAIKECHIDDIIDIKGSIKGEYSRLFIQGQGTALDGSVQYQATKYQDGVENVLVTLKEINSTKLSTLLGQPADIQGEANATLHFDFMNSHHKKGKITYEVTDNNFRGIPIALSSKSSIEDDTHRFTIDVKSPHFILNINQGIYNQKEKIAKASYLLDIPNLSTLETLLGYKYRGSFYARGEVSYAKYLKITGLSKSFGGMSDFVFEKNGLTIELYDVFLHEIMHLFPLPAMLTANATGHLYYNFFENTLVVNTKLKNAKFLHCKLVDIIYKKSGVNMLHETFDDSSLNFTYHESMLLGDLHLANDTSYLNLSNTSIHINKNIIDAYFDFKMQKQEFSGKVYGQLHSPKVNLDMQKLIRYQMDKQVDKLIGKNNRRIMENMPMGNVAKDLATDVGASFMKVFF
ncbi:hypothetical protein MNB_SV-13-902 [hydrothermal vent metagenome]|uniref:AsmA-like C-terminal domain-containing protein n=1 Tax=hydrothermal vent metagenome TaxID=652676 RepID=A0A1W1CUY8_9ZZZZ